MHHPRGFEGQSDMGSQEPMVVREHSFGGVVVRYLC